MMIGKYWYDNYGYSEFPERDAEGCRLHASLLLSAMCEDFIQAPRGSAKKECIANSVARFMTDIHLGCPIAIGYVDWDKLDNDKVNELLRDARLQDAWYWAHSENATYGVKARNEESKRLLGR